MLIRKATQHLIEWKKRKAHKPLIINGARQVGKTFIVRQFGRDYYQNIIEINFALQPKYKTIFDDGFDAESILKNISLKDPFTEMTPGKTLIFFDEIQDCPNCATSLKSFHQDGRYDVVCSGSLMGIHYKEIDSNSVGYKEDYRMFSLDFEEFLWANGYNEHHIDRLYNKMASVQPLSSTEMEVFTGLFRDYMVVGGMPEVVATYVNNKNFSGVLALQRQLMRDYEDDITKYADGMDKARIKAVYKHIPVFLAKENKKFQISKVARGARSREYVGVTEWLTDAGIVNICYCLDTPELPLGDNYIANNFKIYYHDTGMLIAALDEEAQADLRENKNFNTYKGAVYENIIAETLVKQGYSLYFYRNEKSTIEMDFFIRDRQSLIPIEVKANDGATTSLNKLIDKGGDIRYGIKLCNKNIGFNGRFYTFPYFLGFLLKRFTMDRDKNNV